MYNKLFTKILDSSIWLAPDPHRLVWITLIAAMDEDSNAMFASVRNIAARARVSEAEAAEAIKSFEAPDLESGDPENEGRRIERFPGGWKVLNGHKYRAMVTKAIARENTRERVAKHRAEKKKAATCNADVTTCNASVTPSEAVSGSLSEAPKNKTHAPRAQSQFDEVRKEYPRRGGGQRWADAERGYLRSLANGAIHEEVLQGVGRYAAFVRAKGDEGGEYVQQAGTFFGRNEGWREAWVAPTLKRALSPIERVELANGGSLEKRDERVVSEQRSGESVENIFGDVWSTPNAGLRRIGS